MGIDLTLRLLREAELQWLTKEFIQLRDGFSAPPDPEDWEPDSRKPRPELAGFFNGLLIVLDDERRRRVVEGREIQTLMTRGDRPAPTVEWTWGKPDVEETLDKQPPDG